MCQLLEFMLGSHQVYLHVYNTVAPAVLPTVDLMDWNQLQQSSINTLSQLRHEEHRIIPKSSGSHDDMKVVF